MTLGVVWSSFWIYPETHFPLGPWLGRWGWGGFSLFRLTPQGFHELLLRGLRVVPEQCVHGHHHPRGAESTLGAVALGDPLLERHVNGFSRAFSLPATLSMLHSLQFPGNGRTHSLGKGTLPFDQTLPVFLSLGCSWRKWLRSNVL